MQVQTELKFTYADATKRCASLPDLHKVRNAAASEQHRDFLSVYVANVSQPKRLSMFLQGYVLCFWDWQWCDLAEHDRAKAYFGYFKDERHPVSKAETTRVEKHLWRSP